MSRGDQRERDRAKNLARKQAELKNQARGGDPLKRNENDKAALEAKIAAKKSAKEKAELEQPTKAPVERKKGTVGKKDENLDALLIDGLNAGKKKSMRAK